MLRLIILRLRSIFRCRQGVQGVRVEPVKVKQRPAHLECSHRVAGFICVGMILLRIPTIANILDAALGRTRQAGLPLSVSIPILRQVAVDDFHFHVAKEGLQFLDVWAIANLFADKLCRYAHGATGILYI